MPKGTEISKCPSARKCKEAFLIHRLRGQNDTCDTCECKTCKAAEECVDSGCYIAFTPTIGEQERAYYASLYPMEDDGTQGGDCVNAAGEQKAVKLDGTAQTVGVRYLSKEAKEKWNGTYKPEPKEVCDCEGCKQARQRKEQAARNKECANCPLYCCNFHGCSIQGLNTQQHGELVSALNMLNNAYNFMKRRAHDSDESDWCDFIMVSLWELVQNLAHVSEVE